MVDCLQIVGTPRKRKRRGRTVVNMLYKDEDIRHVQVEITYLDTLWFKFKHLHHHLMQTWGEARVNTLNRCVNMTCGEQCTFKMCYFRVNHWP